MPSLNQNFTRLEHDTFMLSFIPTDGTLSSNNWAFWWGLSDNNTSIPGTALLLESWRTNTLGDSLDIYNNTTDCNNTASQLNISQTNPISSNTKFIKGRIQNNEINILMEHGTFSTFDVGEYYHELVLMEVEFSAPNYIAYQCRSHVAATGILTINNSTFTNRTYR